MFMDQCDFCCKQQWDCYKVLQAADVQTAVAVVVLQFNMTVTITAHLQDFFCFLSSETVKQDRSPSDFGVQ